MSAKNGYVLNIKLFKKAVYNGAHFLFEKLIKPKSENEDKARREFILNILLLGATILSFVMFLIVFYRSVIDGIDRTDKGFSTLFIFIFFVIHLIFLVLSKKGYSSITSRLFMGLYFIPTTFMAYVWGAEMPSTWIFYILIIFISGILISSKFAFAITILSSLILIVFNYLHIENIFHPNLYWKGESLSMPEIFAIPFIFIIIAIISWLSNREIEKSLKRARKSEVELQKEKESLEVKVEERTEELKMAQLERVSQLHRFAEFGKLSSGLFHDLLNPLTAVSLNMEQIKGKEEFEEIKEAKAYLKRAISATKRIENFISAIRKQISNQENKVEFFLKEEINQAIQLLSYKARKANVKIVFEENQNIKMFGDSVKFNHIVTNLIGNAIDSYNDLEVENKKIDIGIKEDDGNIYLSVEDYGMGISQDIIDKIFQPFFTTKEYKSGMGIGLSLMRQIIEKDFGGKIEVESPSSAKATAGKEQNKGSKFTIKFPRGRSKSN